MRFNESISKILTTHDEWREWLQTIIDTRHQWLTSQNYSGCFHSVSNEQYPERYPVLALLDATTHGFSLSYIYQDQMMELVGLKDKHFIHTAEAELPTFEELDNRVI